MSENSSGNEQNQDNNRTPSSSSPESGGSNSPNVREFIYLDQPKILSYLSQLEGGLRQLIVNVEKELAADENTSPTQETITRYALESHTSGKIPLIAELDGTASMDREAHFTSAGRKTTTSSTAYRADLSILHHQAFDLVMERMGGKFLTLEGRTSIFSLNRLFEALPTESLPPDAKSGLEMLQKLQLGNLAYIENPDRHLHSFLLDEHFTIPSQFFQIIYGSPSELDFTIVGISAQHPSKSRRQVPKQVSRLETKKMFVQLNSVYELVYEALGMDSGERIYPLAIYKTF